MSSNSIRGERRAYKERVFEIDFKPMPEQVMGQPFDPMLLKLLIVPVVTLLALWVRG